MRTLPDIKSQIEKLAELNTQINNVQTTLTYGSIVDLMQRALKWVLDPVNVVDPTDTLRFFYESNQLESIENK